MRYEAVVPEIFYITNNHLQAVDLIHISYKHCMSHQKTPTAKCLICVTSKVYQKQTWVSLVVSSFEHGKVFMEKKSVILMLEIITTAS